MSRFVQLCAALPSVQQGLQDQIFHFYAADTSCSVSPSGWTKIFCVLFRSCIHVLFRFVE